MPHERCGNCLFCQQHIQVNGEYYDHYGQPQKKPVGPWHKCPHFQSAYTVFSQVESKLAKLADAGRLLTQSGLEKRLGKTSPPFSFGNYISRGVLAPQETQTHVS